MGRQWTDEQRQRQAEAIRRWAPWNQSTGPRTAKGKARASRNAYQGGTRVQMRKLGRALREHGHMLADLLRGAR